MVKLLEAESKEVEQVVPSTVVHRETRAEAIDLFNLATRVLREHRPLDISTIIPRAIEGELGIGKLCSALAITVTGIIVYPLTGDPIWMLAITPGLLLMTLIGWTEISVDHNRNGKFDKFLYKMFLSKKQKFKLHKRQEIFKSHSKSIELYQMLLETTMVEFEKYQTFEIINDLSNPEHNEFVCINDLSGEPFLVDRRKYVEALKRPKLNNPDELNKALTKTLQEKIALLSLDSDAGATKEVTS